MSQLMHTYIILLRGIMPTGKNRLVMSELKSSMQNAGLQKVSTYRNTGNIILSSAMQAGELEKQIQQVINTDLQVDVVVFAKTIAQVEQALDNNPYDETYQPNRIFYNFLYEKVDEEKLQNLLQQNFGEDELRYHDGVLYSYIPVDASKSKLSNAFLEKQCAVRMTARNKNTLLALVEKAKAQ